MDINRAITYPFDDKDWLKKILIGGILLIIPIVNFIAVGYFIRVLKNLLNGTETPLPEWDDFGGDFMRGLWPSIAGIVYAIPGAIVWSISVAMFASKSGFVNFLGIIFVLIAIVYYIAYALAYPAMLVSFAKKEEFAGFFAFAEIWDYVKSNLKDYIVAILLVIVAFAVASAVGGIALGIGVIFTEPLAMLIAMHLLAQVDRAKQGDIL